MRSRWERAFAVGLAALLLVLALAAQLLHPGSEPVGGSVASAAAGGRRALLLLLRDLGFRAEPWNDPPGALPDGDALLWLARAPERPGKPEESQAEKKEDKEEEKKEEKKAVRSPADLGARDPSRYRRFVAAGGTLVLPQGGATRAFLSGALGLDAEDLASAPPGAPAGVRTLADGTGEELEVEVGEGGVLAPPAREPVASVLWRTKEGESLATEIPLERGRVVLLGSDVFLDNARIGDHDHALLAVRLAERLAPGGRVYFDEYALGRWQPRSAVDLLASPRLFLASLHAVLIVLLLALRSAWVREFPRDPAPLDSASPLLRARTLASLLARAGRHDLLARFLRDGVSRRLDRRSTEAAARIRALPLAPCRSAEELERLHASLAAIERDVV